ncbi:MAG: hypothetical protein GXY44_05810 [Phycisphaerales bacterium]|nr:hypothetical protein [Phycisphaerales bacterium]
MKIVYGIHGFGRGHAMRALAILPELTKRHEVVILAGGDAYHALSPDYPVIRVPTMAYYRIGKGRISVFRTVKRNLPMLLDIAASGAVLEMALEIMREFRPDFVISDSEVYTHRAARQLRIPRMTFDHFGFLVYCRPEMSRIDRLRCWGNALVYRWLFGEPERVLVASFFDASARRSEVRLVGPVIREEVRSVEASRGDHLLVYFSKGDQEFSQRIRHALLELDCPVRIYGTSCRGLQENLQFKPLSNLPFIEDLASSRAVFGTTGNQLISEVLYYGKPLLGMPIDCLEQRLNAAQIERLGMGVAGRVKTGHYWAG